MTRKFLSSGAHFCAVIATMNLVLMAAIANDESVGNRMSPTASSGPPTTTTTGGGPPPPRALPSLSAAVAASSSLVASSLSSSSSTGARATIPTPSASATYYPVTPSIQNLVRSQSFDYPVVTNKPGGGSSSNIKNTNGSSSGYPVTPVPLTMAKYAGSHHDHPQYNSTISMSSSSLANFDGLMNASTSPFVTLNSTVLRAQYKSNALLPCNVRNSGDGNTVSWIRRKDYHLLTVGLQTYSSDDRFAAIHAQSPDDWTLKIKYVQPRDAGIYECQVSTHPPSSIFVTLLVVEARAEIVGGPEKFFQAGSSVELRCDLIDSTEEPEYVFWYQGLRMINYDPSRRINVTHSKTSSMLVIHNVQKTDSGNYTCVPSNAHPASIFVHIINGENPAAMQHGSHSTTCVPCPPLWFLSFLLSLTLQTFYLRFLSRNVDHNHHHHTNNLSHNSHQQQEHQKYDEQKQGDNNSTATRQQSHHYHHHHNQDHVESNSKNEYDSEYQDESQSNRSIFSLPATLPGQQPENKVTTLNPYHLQNIHKPHSMLSEERCRRKCQVGVLR